MKDIPIIKCPICGAEYLPVEVFIPDVFFGKPEEIIKDTTDAVEFVLGDNMNLEESYICDGCNTKLKIKANLSFEVEANKEESFEEEYISTFTKPKKLKLEEANLFEDD